MNDESRAVTTPPAPCGGPPPWPPQSRDGGTQLDALRAERETLQAFMDAIPESALLIDAQGTLLAVNRTTLERLGLRREDVLGRPIYDIVPPEVAQRRRVHVARAIETRRVVRFEDQRAGRRIENTLYPVFDDAGAVTRLAVLGVDVTERRETEAALEESRRRMQTLVSNLPGIAYRCRNDPDWTMEFISDGCEDLTGYRSEELVGNRVHSYAELIHEADRQAVWDGVQQGLGERWLFRLTYRIRTARHDEKWVLEQGRGVFDADGRVQALEGFITDITEPRLAELKLQRTMQALQQAYADLEAHRAQLAELVVRDPLTGLYNRRELDRALQQELSRVQRQGQSVALLILDLDHFKVVNDTWGHPTGDQVLVAVADLLRAQARPSDRLIRYGGEEFAVVAPLMPPHDGAALAERIRARMAATPLKLTGPDGAPLELPLTLSVGLACAPQDARDEGTLIAAADEALYRAKRRGRNRVERASAPGASPASH